MGCTSIRLADGSAAIICTRGTRQRRRQCYVCGSAGRYQCDAPTGHSITCSRWLCEAHRYPAGRNLDYCPEHRGRDQLMLELEL